MNKLSISLFLSLLFLFISSCQENTSPLIEIDKVSAWCILGFDSLDRSPEERIAMLQELGIKKYGFNRGKADYSKLTHEFKLAQENNIEITSVFLWLNANKDSIGHLSESNEALLAYLKELDQKPTIWVSFNNNYFENLDHQAALNAGVDMVKYIKSRADDLGCKLALYNHTGWFGNPLNQIEIIKAVDQDGITIVYNFHHAHDNIDIFKANIKEIIPYLSCVNLNGVKKGGPKILDIGKGEHEYEMIKDLKEAGYLGPWGILGHVKTEDAKVVLERNIEGLKALNSLHNKNG